MINRSCMLLLLLALHSHDAAAQSAVDDKPETASPPVPEQPPAREDEDVFVEDVFISDAPPPVAEAAAPNTGTANRSNRFRRFRPSDAISADNAVPFPVDI